MRKTGVIAIVGLLTLLFTGCAPTPDGARAELEHRADTVNTAAQDVLLAMDAAGLHSASAAGRVEYCGGSLKPGLAYSAGASATVGEDLAGAIAAVSEELQLLGWQPEGEIGDDRLSARFTRDDVTIDVKAGGAVIGGKAYGEDEMQVGIIQADDCVRVPDGVHATDFADLEKEILPRE